MIMQLIISSDSKSYSFESLVCIMFHDLERRLGYSTYIYSTDPHGLHHVLHPKFSYSIRKSDINISEELFVRIRKSETKQELKDIFLEVYPELVL